LWQTIADSDVEVRDASAMALASVRRLIGDKPFAILVGADIIGDKQKMAKIDESLAKLNEELGGAIDLHAMVASVHKSNVCCSVTVVYMWF
jgi:hypothetical protein